MTRNDKKQGGCVVSGVEIQMEVVDISHEYVTSDVNDDVT